MNSDEKAVNMVKSTMKVSIRAECCGDEKARVLLIPIFTNSAAIMKGTELLAFSGGKQEEKLMLQAEPPKPKAKATASDTPAAKAKAADTPAKAKGKGKRDAGSAAKRQRKE